MARDSTAAREKAGEGPGALRLERDELRRTLDAVLNGILILDLDGRLVDCNTAVWKGMGLASKAEALGRRAAESLFDPLGFEEQLAAARAEGAPRKFECVFQAGGSALRTVELSLALRQDEAGRPAGFVAVASDVSERLRAAGALKLLNQLAIEFAAAPDEGLYAFVAEKVRAAFDARALAITSYDPAARELEIRHVAVAGGVLPVLERTLGRALAGTHLKVDPKDEQQMLEQIVSHSHDLANVSLGLLSQAMARSLSQLVGVGEVCGLAFTQGGAVLGAALLAMPPCPFPLSREMLNVLANLMAVTLARLPAESARGP